jgi:hypothetical protein
MNQSRNESLEERIERKTLCVPVFVFGENKIGNGFLSSAVGEIVVAV